MRARPFWGARANRSEDVMLILHVPAKCASNHEVLRVQGSVACAKECCICEEVLRARKCCICGELCKSKAARLQAASMLAPGQQNQDHAIDYGTVSPAHTICLTV